MTKGRLAERPFVFLTTLPLGYLPPTVGPPPNAVNGVNVPVGLLVPEGHCCERTSGIQTGDPQHVSIAQVEPGGHSQLGPQRTSPPHDVLPGVQNGVWPAQVETQTQSAFALLQDLNVVQVAPEHSGCGGGPQDPFVQTSSAAQQVVPHVVVPVGHTH